MTYASLAQYAQIDQEMAVDAPTLWHQARALDDWIHTQKSSLWPNPGGVQRATHLLHHIYSSWRRPKPEVYRNVPPVHPHLMLMLKWLYPRRAFLLSNSAGSLWTLEYDRSCSPSQYLSISILYLALLP